MKLVVKFPTRNRPNKFMPLLDRYIAFLGGKHQVEFRITMDEDDATMNNSTIRSFLDTRKETHPTKLIEVLYWYGNSKTKIEAVNANMEDADGDVLLLASDDMVPVGPGYDDVIHRVFDKYIPDYNGSVKFWDGYRPAADDLMTLAVMGFPLYRKFGYIYNPAYKSLFCDNEQTIECIRNGTHIKVANCIIQHQWSPEPWDSLHERNEDSEVKKHDKKIFIEYLKSIGEYDNTNK